MTKTYALFDLIGVGEALNAGTADKLLVGFWDACENWTNFLAKNKRVTLEDGAGMNAMPRVVAYSDSAILWHEPELQLQSFYDLARHLKARIEEVGKCYAIVAHGDEITPREATIFVSAAGDPRPLYQNVLGSGDVVKNLYLAEHFVRGKKDWHQKGYSLYCVGSSSVPDGGTKEQENTAAGDVFVIE